MHVLIAHCEGQYATALADPSADKIISLYGLGHQYWWLFSCAFVHFIRNCDHFL